MDYHFKPIGKTCAATGKELVPGTVCYSVLVDEGSEPVRRDYSEEGWSGPPEGTIGQWQCVVPAAEDAKPKPLDTDALMTYFEQLSEELNPAQEKLRYVLAWLLIQKRRLRQDGTRRDGDIEYLQLVSTGGEGSFEVREQQLTDDEIDQLQQTLNSQLAAQWS
jgi:hypothetical protein